MQNFVHEGESLTGSGREGPCPGVCRSYQAGHHRMLGFDLYEISLQLAAGTKISEALYDLGLG
jgi:hypothetical protein